MKNIGIWLDKEKAFVISLENNTENFVKIPSEVETYHVRGGSGTKFKGGPQDVVQDSKYLEREKHQLKAYFQKLVTYLNDADQFAIFGPAEVPQKFQKEIEENYISLNEKLKKVVKADSMTDNQTVSLVRDFFNPQ